MKVVLSRTLALGILVSMALVALAPVAGADPSPTQAPNEGEMMTSMAQGSDWLLTVARANGQLNPPTSAQPWEVESAGRAAMVGLALLKAYQVTGTQTYLDRAIACGDLLAMSVDAGVAYVVDRTGVLPTEAGGGFPNVQQGMVDEAFQAGYVGPVRFQLWESLRGIWFLSELYSETEATKYATAATLLDRLIGDQFYGNDDPVNGLVDQVTLANDGEWTEGGLASTTEHGMALQGVLVAGNSLPNLYRDQYTIISYISGLQRTDGSIDDRVILPGQDSTSETRHAFMIPALFGLGGLREARDLMAWVKTQQLTDGSFDCPHDKDPFGDTACAVFGLLPSGEVAVGGDGLSWLLDAQQVDGSWNFVPNRPPDAGQIKSTTWALLAVHAGLTNYNLRLDTSMVGTEAVWEGDPARVTGFTVDVTVANDGLVEVKNASVRIYDGPREGKLLLDEVSIDVPALGNASRTLDFFPEERGPHEVHVWVVYAPGGEFKTRDNNASVMVNINRQPTGAIGSPESGHLFGFGAFIWFEAVDVLDLDGDTVTHEWTDNVTGVLSDQPAFHHVLPPGDHRVVLVMGDGNGPDTVLNVTFSVRQNIPPTVRISTPAEGDQYFDYQAITFNASASSDAEEHPLEYTWMSNVDGRLGTGELLVRKLTTGDHRITVWVDDGWDNVSKHVDIRILQTYPPVPVVFRPVDGEQYVTTTRIQFDSQGTADPDSDILEFFWTSNIDGLLSQRPSFLARLRVGHHRITLAVTDGNYNVTTTVEIDVLDNRPPVTIITSPAPDSEWNSTEVIELNGSTSYDLEDPISYFWISDRSGPLGSDSVILTRLPRGDHTITLWVNDGFGHNVSAVVMVSVRNLGPTAGISSPSEDGTYYTGQDIPFSSASSTDPEGDRLTYEWYVRLGDGDWQSMGTSAQARRTFDRAGRYQVRLVVKDAQYSSEAIVPFTVKKGAGGGEEDGLPLGMLAIVVVLIIVATMAGILLMRQGGEELG